MQLPSKIKNSTNNFMLDTSNDFKDFLEKLKELINNIDSIDTDNDKDIDKENDKYYENYWKLGDLFRQLANVDLDDIDYFVDVKNRFFYCFTINERIKLCKLSKNIFIFNKLLGNIIDPNVQNKLYKGSDKLYRILLNKKDYLGNICNGSPYNKKAKKDVFNQLSYISSMLEQLSYAMNNINDAIVLKSR